MFKKALIVCWLCTVLVLSLGSLCGAVEIPPGFVKDEVVSQKALELAKTEFTSLKTQLIEKSKAMEPDVKILVEQVISLIDEKLQRLRQMDVYFATSATYQDAYTFYKGKLGNWEEVANDDLRDAVASDEYGVIPAASLESLNALLEQGKVKAATGTSGNARLSLSTVYINPETKAVIEKTTIVVAIE